MKIPERRAFIKNMAFLSLASVASQKLIAADKPYNSIPFADDAERNLTFVFQGDSITDGERSRNNDLNNNTGHGYVYCIAARVGADFPDRNLKFFNRGVIGSDIVALADRWQEGLDLKPDVLSVLIGINDSNGYLQRHNEKNSVAAYEATYRSLLDKAKASNPNLIIVLCQPFTLPYTLIKDQQIPMAADIIARQEVVKKLVADYNTLYVPFQDVFNNALKKAPEKYWVWDHVHPTVAGHELLTREWLKCISKRLKFLKKEV
jgi:lysophospholipase L1-like esterase